MNPRNSISVAKAPSTLLIEELLRRIGEDPYREGLQDTPRRVVKSWEELFSGYAHSPKSILGTDFESEGYTGMIIVPTIDFSTFCEHHWLPFGGTVDIAYIPGKKKRVLGLSKFGRLVEVFARRLQIQERFTHQIARAIQKHLKPKGVAVRVKAAHSCMRIRGVKKQNAEMITTSLFGVFDTDNATRNEFLTQLGK